MHEPHVPTVIAHLEFSAGGQLVRRRHHTRRHEGIIQCMQYQRGYLDTFKELLTAGPGIVIVYIFESMQGGRDFIVEFMEGVQLM